MTRPARATSADGVTTQASGEVPDPSDGRESAPGAGAGARALALTSLVFIFLQSLCTAIIAISGVRLAIGLGAFAAASGVASPILAFHADRYRTPMIVVAVVGSCINLYVVRRIRSLRGRSSAQWRATPVDPKQRRAESIQIGLAMLTLFLAALELAAHHILHGRF